MFSDWLQGGLYLEVSFLLKIKEDRKTTINVILNNLSDIQTIDLVDETIDKKVNDFIEGYSDTDGPNTFYHHSINLNAYVHLPPKKRTIIHIEQISSDSLVINFLFDGFDIEEVRPLKGKITEYITLLKELYYHFEFKVGGIALDEDVEALFNCNELYPSECYKFDNLTINYSLKQLTYFKCIIWNMSYEHTFNKKYDYQYINNNGLLIESIC
ncbi:hypothetical protein [Bacillus solimangrovi]|uniref:Uncharacterized protein n=1 Tax=Bacillus solimangrovi TaxID=1305675 RepID=A0A1E5LK15_9BACI|nr:hypothetical protein [Bacillus solimangrovi]OEH94376.1 hypothetical protein BFG57_07880 [Bacillus solimangrovi]